MTHELVLRENVNHLAIWRDFAGNFENLENRNAVVKFLWDSYNTLLVNPLLKLYLYGPRFGGWGFWGGKDSNDICAQLTNVPSEFWAANREECFHLITKSFYSFLIIFEILCYMCFLYICFVQAKQIISIILQLSWNFINTFIFKVKIPRLVSRDNDNQRGYNKSK